MYSHCTYPYDAETILLTGDEDGLEFDDDMAFEAGATSSALLPPYFFADVKGLLERLDNPAALGRACVAAVAAPLPSLEDVRVVLEVRGSFIALLLDSVGNNWVLIRVWRGPLAEEILHTKDSLTSWLNIPLKCVGLRFKKKILLHLNPLCSRITPPLPNSDPVKSMPVTTRATAM